MKDCKFCDKTGLLILPLRYAAVAADQAKSLLPALVGTLGNGVDDISLGHAAYAPRLLREGYLYVLVVRRGIRSWEGYAATEEAFLYKFPVDTPPTVKIEFSCDRTSCGIDASCVAIDRVEFVDKVFFLFTPSAMTVAKLDEYKANADAYAASGKMQVFDPKAWAKGGSRSQPHSLVPGLLGLHVAEWILYKQCAGAQTSELGEAMRRQLFPAISAAYAGVPAPAPDKPQPGRLGLLQDKLERLEGAAFVVYDHIGVTQELNDFRNAALSPVEHFLAKREGETDNQRRLDVMQAIDDVRGSVKSHFVKLNAQSIQRVDEMNLPNHGADRAAQLRAVGRVAEAEVIEAQMKEHERRKARTRQRLLDGTDAEAKWQSTYAALLDQGEIDRFRAALETLSERCGKQANARAPDHLLWLKSSKLVDAFDLFDPADQGSGFEFHREHVHCTHGMFGVESNHPTLSAWMNVDKVERKNLYMRANLFNHQDLIQQADATFAAVRQATRAAGGVEFVPPDQLAKFTRGLVDAFKKADSAWDEWLRDDVVKELQDPKSDQTKYKDGQKKLSSEADRQQYRYRMAKLSKFHATNQGVALARIGEWTRGTTSRGGRMDQGIVAVAGLLLYTRLGRLTDKIGMESFLLKFTAENFASIKARTERAVAEGRMTPEQARQHLENHDRGGKYAGSVVDAARDRAKTAAGAEAAKVRGSLVELVRDEQAKLRERISLSIDELDKGQRPSTNNFRQMRMGALMMSLEGLALTSKLTQHAGELTARERMEICGSILALSSMSFDLMYAAAKSIRELSAFGSKVTPNLNLAADITRGGFKLAAGILSTAAGAISVVLDLQSAYGEGQKKTKDWFLVGLYTVRIGVGGLNAVIGFIAAFSYAGPMLRYLGKETLARSAERVALVRTMWLIRVARFNMIGLGLTAVEFGYTWIIKDDELEVWCKTSTFRKDKTTNGIFAKTPYISTAKELEALQKAFLMMTGQPPTEPAAKHGTNRNALTSSVPANVPGP
jgi:hypothetical protein